jgi:hypothetical protein
MIECGMEAIPMPTLAHRRRLYLSSRVNWTLMLKTNCDADMSIVILTRREIRINDAIFLKIYERKSECRYKVLIFVCLLVTVRLTQESGSRNKATNCRHSMKPSETYLTAEPAPIGQLLIAAQCLLKAPASHHQVTATSSIFTGNSS